MTSQTVSVRTSNSREPVTLVAALYFVLFAAAALDAYSIGPIPITWLAQFGFIGVAFALIVGMNRVQAVPGGALILALIICGLLANTINVFRFPPEMPRAATLPYIPFVVARYLHILSFAAAFYLTFWLLTREHQQEVIKGVVVIGTAVAIIALYFYAAQLFGLPQPPRTRFGTGAGGSHAQVFTSGTGVLYHRAMGTFREPGHFAEWLLLPLFLSTTRHSSHARIMSLLLVMAMLLSVSLTGIFSAVIGLVLALLLLNPLRRRNLRILLVVVFVMGGLAIAAKYVHIGAAEADVTIFSMVEARVKPMFERGVGATNRVGVVQFVIDHPPPWYGFGMGNGNIYPARVQNTDVMMSYLSAYVAIWYSAGVIGLALLLLFMLRPIARILAGRARGAPAWLPGVLAAYIAYLASFAVLTEELSIHFGVVAGLLFYGTRASSRSLNQQFVPDADSVHLPASAATN